MGQEFESLNGCQDREGEQRRAHGEDKSKMLDGGNREQTYLQPHLYVLLAQLDRAPGYGPGGRGFESFTARQFKKKG